MKSENEKAVDCYTHRGPDILGCPASGCPYLHSCEAYKALEKSLSSKDSK